MLRYFRPESTSKVAILAVGPRRRPTRIAASTFAPDDVLDDRSRTDVNLCRQDTGAPVDIWLAAPTMAVTRWWLGERSWAQLLRDPDVHLHGDLALQRQMHRWFARYVFSPEALGTPR